MPAIPVPEEQASQLADYVRSLNATAFEAKPEGDVAAGERYFFGEGDCSSCHTAAGRGDSNGPDLSGIARQLTLPELGNTWKGSPMTHSAAGRQYVAIANGSNILAFALPSN
jgi:mono/diheme cytochrome c family protein